MYSDPTKGKDAYIFEATNENLIGTGGFASVFKAARRYDKQEFAIKR
jgi:hypothetical protein